jgi:hypothetical protein
MTLEEGKDGAASNGSLRGTAMLNSMDRLCWLTETRE